MYCSAALFLCAFLSLSPNLASSFMVLCIICSFLRHGLRRLCTLACTCSCFFSSATCGIFLFRIYSCMLFLNFFCSFFFFVFCALQFFSFNSLVFLFFCIFLFVFLLSSFLPPFFRFLSLSA